MKLTMTNYLHSIDFEGWGYTYSVSTKFEEGHDIFEITVDDGAFCNLLYTADSVEIEGGDEKGRKFTVTLASVEEKIHGTAKIGKDRLETQAPTEWAMRRLREQFQKNTDLEDQMPKSTALSLLAKEMSHNPQLVYVMAGHDKPRSTARKSYCEAICECCSDGGWMAPWCCISCASCDVFEVKLRAKLFALM